MFLAYPHPQRAFYLVTDPYYDVVRGFLLTPDIETHRAGSVDLSAGRPTDVILLNGETGSCHLRRVFVRARDPLSLTILRAPTTSGPSGAWALWIYEGESLDRVPVEFRTRSGRVVTLGDANACLPLKNTIAPGSCVPPIADLFGHGPLGITVSLRQACVTAIA
jgi:hypothetical protein